MMIRYPITDAALRSAINAENGNWLERANAHTRFMRTTRRFDEGGPSWSDIKIVLMRLQHMKCAYCERTLESEENGRIEHDVEHYRPKARVTEWARAEQTLQRETGRANSRGYYWLAYEPWNYAIACKTCNTALKSDAFPIAGPRGKPFATSRALRSEKPYLCYPIGAVDEDPAHLVTFEGTLAVPAARRGRRLARGKAIIAFFELNEREGLHVERAKAIALLFPQLEQAPVDRLARDFVAAITSNGSSHANCCRAFKRLYESNPNAARQVYDSCRDYIIGRKWV
jgi:hypothetical protein